jgi:hypothetical protein
LPSPEAMTELLLLAAVAYFIVNALMVLLLPGLR